MGRKPDPDQSPSRLVEADRLWWTNLAFGLRISGMLLVALTLLWVPRHAQAATTTEEWQTTFTNCQRMLNGLVEEAGPSAIRVAVSGTPSKFSSARIYVSDGEVRIDCNDSSGRMSLTRVINKPDTSIDSVGLLGH